MDEINVGVNNWVVNGEPNSYCSMLMNTVNLEVDHGIYYQGLNAAVVGFEVPDDGGSMDFLNVGKLLQTSRAQQTRRQPAIFSVAVHKGECW